jgi:glycine/D-amino acid oxidase-like deaminating enzyme
MPKIAIVGAGGYVFPLRLVGDLLSFPALRDSTIALMDIDPAGAERVRRNVRELEPVMPVLKKAEVDEIRSGTVSVTPDSHFILDEVPGRKGLYVMTGCQEAGITHGPALGKMMAELLVDGKTDWQREQFRLTRFRGG